jgi:uncharacterized protein (UPF0332 family)
VTPEAATLARHRLQRARESLREADVLRAAAAPNGAVNRYYYAAFHAARALLATLGLDSARHSGVIALFNQHFVKTGLIPTDTARVLVRSFEKRLKSDYSDHDEASLDDVR